MHQDTMKGLFLTMKKNINQTYNSKYIPVTDWMKSIISTVLDVGTRVGEATMGGATNSSRFKERPNWPISEGTVAFIILSLNRSSVSL